MYFYIDYYKKESTVLTHYCQYNCAYNHNYTLKNIGKDYSCQPTYRKKKEKSVMLTKKSFVYMVAVTPLLKTADVNYLLSVREGRLCVRKQNLKYFDYYIGKEVTD